jgi:uroporphyrin-III C-methyltransferase/precorrin-2 dehydrogenase/sirohydrochlorin ferrochelatase
MMKTFPMFLTMTGRRVAIAGGGEQAAQKCRLILKTDAQITVLAAALDPELCDLHAAGKINWDKSQITQAHFADTALVFIATGCPGIDSALHDLAKQAGATVNVVDRPDLCDAITPSIVDRSPVVVAIGTEGTAPVLARQIKTRMEEILEPRLGDLAAVVGRLRESAAQRLQPRQRRDLWRWVFNGPVRDAHKRGAEREAAQLIKNAIAAGDFDTSVSATVAFVGAGPGAKDLMTLRGVQRLQEADIIFYDQTVDIQILELARRDAARVNLDQTSDWPKQKNAGLLIAAARQGKRVVRLSGGNTEPCPHETGTLSAAKIAFETVPGIHTASPVLSQAI